MTKREILDWLDSQWQQTITQYRKETEKQMLSFMDKHLEKSGLRETAEQIQQHLEQAIQLWQDWKQSQEGNKHWGFEEGYYCLEHELGRFTLQEGTLYKHFLKREVRLHTEEFEQLKSARQSMDTNINHSYHQLKQVISRLKTAKEAVEYLETLGFDLSSLSEPSDKAPTVEISTAFLFPEKAA